MTMPREGLYRSAPTFEVRAAEGDEPDGVTLFGYFARFDEWTEINSAYEGHFMERIAPGAFKKTFSERAPKVLFQHGNDPEVGGKPIAEITTLREDKQGAYYEARLFDGLPPLIADGLRSGQYGASFSFQLVRADEVLEPERSDDNPDGIPERINTEVRVREFGPVTFGQYAGATAGVRSLTDDYVLERLVSRGTMTVEEARRALGLDTSTETSDEEPAPPQGTPASVLRAIAEAKARDARFAALRAGRFVK
jgi:HK97 family phage prohead protease